MADDPSTLARLHVPGTGEPTVKRLQSGVSNSSYEVTRDGIRYALRVAEPGGALMGVDRDWERRVLQQVQRAQLSPLVECCLPGDGILVTRWVDGVRWTAAEAASAGKLPTVAGLIRRVHAVRAPVLARTMTPTRWIDLYRRALAQRGAAVDDRPGAPALPAPPALSARARELEQVYARFGPRPGVLCHSDLHRHNLIASADRLVVLDWEYAHVGDPFWDLAGWMSMNDLPPADAEALLAAYLGRPPRDEERARLTVLQWFFDYVGFLWGELCVAVLGNRLPPDPGDRQRLLLARLMP